MICTRKVRHLWRCISIFEPSYFLLTILRNTDSNICQSMLPFKNFMAQFVYRRDQYRMYAVLYDVTEYKSTVLRYKTSIRALLKCVYLTRSPSI